MPLLSRVVRPPVTKGGSLFSGPFVMVVSMTCDKRSGVLYKPRRLPDRHIAVFRQIASLPPLSSLLPPLVALVPDAPLFSGAPRRSSPTCAQRCLPPSASSAAPTSALTDAHLRPRRGASPRRGAPPWLAAPLALIAPRWLSSCSPYVAPPSPTPPLVGPPLRLPAAVRVPRWPVGRAGFCLADVSPWNAGVSKHF
jgi:hypothetical protein